MAAARIAKRVRRAISIDSMAYFYDILEAIQSSIRRGTRSSNKWRLSLRAHFIMDGLHATGELCQLNKSSSPRSQGFDRLYLRFGEPRRWKLI